MAISRKPLDVNNYSALDGGTGLAIPGYYRRTNLNDIINNFMVAYVGDGKVLTKVPRYEVAFWAQRSVQEFSYDVLHSEKSIEVELSPTKSISLPSDYVNYVRIEYTDSNGVMRPILPSRTTTANKAIAQDQDYKYLYDQDGNIVFEETSETINKYQSDVKPLDVEQARDYYNGYFDNDNYLYYGQRYGSTPEFQNINGTFVLDAEAGIVYFDSAFKEGSYITFTYISDGLGDNGNFDNVYVPKLAEDAIYASILYNLSKLRGSAAGVAALYKKEASAKMRNAKIRLSNMKLTEMTQIMRNKSKWIKH